MSGPTDWASSGGSPFVGEGFYFDGTIIDGGSMVPLEMTRGSGAVSLNTMARTNVRQVFWLGGNQPVNMAPITATVEVTIAEEADFWVMREAADKGGVVEIWFGWPMTDWWYAPGGDGTLTEWHLSRPMAYGLVTGVTQVTYPPECWIDDVSQTINTSGSASSGVVVLNSGSGFKTFETIALAVDTYTWIQLRYYPMLQVTIESMTEAYQQHNDLVFQMELREHMGGVYLAAEGAIEI